MDTNSPILPPDLEERKQNLFVLPNRTPPLWDSPEEFERDLQITIANTRQKSDETLLGMEKLCLQSATLYRKALTLRGRKGGAA